MTTKTSSESGSAGTWWKDPWWWGIGAVALAVRAFYLVDLPSTPFFGDPQMDALYHHRWAERIAAGSWWGDAVFFRAPLYPYFLGLLYALGVGATGVRVVQVLIGTGTALLTAGLARERFGRGPSLVAGLLVALSGPLVYFECELLLVVLEAPLFLLSLWSLDRASTRSGNRAWAWAGGLAGAAALVRPTVLVTAGLAAFVAARSRRPRAFLFYAAALLLALAPALVHNAVAGRDLVPVASQGGLNYYLGNNPASDGMAAIAPGFRRTWTGGVEDAQRIAERERGHALRPSEVSRYWYGRAFAWAFEDPAAFLRHQGRKFMLFWDGFEVPNNQDYYFFSRLTRVFRLPVLWDFGVLMPLVLAGLAMGLWRRRLPWMWVAFPLLLVAVIAAFFVTARFRASLVPMLSIWAAVGLSVAWRAGARRDAGILGVYLALVLAGALWVRADVHGLRAAHSPAESHLRIGIAHAARGEPEAAREAYRQAVAARPGFADGWNNLGTLEAQTGDLHAARDAFTRALQAEPDHPKALGNLAALAFQQGRTTEADSLARATLRVAGREPEALYNAAVVLGNLGRIELARDAFAVICDQQPWNPAARVGLARAWFALGERKRAVDVLEAHPPERRDEAMRALARDWGLHWERTP